MRKCVEARLVFDDGTVERATGEAALIVDGVLHQQCIDRSESSGWTTARSLRKVTVLPRAVHRTFCGGDGFAWRDKLAGGTPIVRCMGLAEMIPSVARGSPDDTRIPVDGADDVLDGGPPGAWRIEVEVVPEKEGR